ncbi:hypothetical protein I6E84_05050 [Psychrobacter sp. SCQQ22]|uniref:Uncharacterized protein n=1 Tax=Psychrobacter fozii TaxID=198480 RepID=A0A2V4UFW3_9GAMM|nr:MULTISPECIES: hypothetical protein [Psychrobacter]MBF0659099.1 hypothetical protein [Psychrobacter sp. NG25]MBH0085584.1 hypothetical protein [Psychrobacter sp. SCQQ22]PYE39037.1 hypothetical protein DFP82_105191 [Psychrobacter fozii]
MNKQNNKFVLATATLAEVNKQLKINMLVTVVVAFVLFMNMMKFMSEKTFFYAALVVLMIFLLFFIRKARNILMLRKQELTQ